MLFLFKLLVLVEHVHDLSSDTLAWLDVVVFLEIHTNFIEFVHGNSSVDDLGSICVLVGVASAGEFVVLVTVISFESAEKIRHFVLLWLLFSCLLLLWVLIFVFGIVLVSVCWSLWSVEIALSFSSCFFLVLGFVMELSWVYLLFGKNLILWNINMSKAFFITYFRFSVGNVISPFFIVDINDILNLELSSACQSFALSLSEKLLANNICVVKINDFDNFFTCFSIVACGFTFIS